MIAKCSTTQKLDFLRDRQYYRILKKSNSTIPIKYNVGEALSNKNRHQFRVENVLCERYILQLFPGTFVFLTNKDDRNIKNYFFGIYRT